MIPIQVLVKTNQKEKLTQLAVKNKTSVSALIRYVLSKNKLTASIFKEVELIK